MGIIKIMPCLDMKEGRVVLEHFYEAVTQGGAQILLAASVFHYHILSIREVKDYLRKKGLRVEE